MHVGAASASSPTAMLAADRILRNGPLFGRLTKAGKSFLLRNGWEDISEDSGQIDKVASFADWEKCIDDHDTSSDSDHRLLAFAWPNKSGPQLPTHQVGPALVRPFPTSITEIIDDKVHLQNLLEDTGIMPPSTSLSSLSESDNDSTQDNKLYFVKHRHGVQGRAVYVHTKQSLKEWFSGQYDNSADFVVQEEVVPALDDDGRKFALRAHVLLFNKTIDGGKSDDEEAEGDSCTFVAALHENVICHTHSIPYSRSAKDRSAHISNAAAGAKKKQCRKKKSKHKGIDTNPSPSLISDLPGFHPAHGSFDRIKSCVSVLTDAYISHLLSNHTCRIDPSATCFALIGVDLLMSSEGSIKLCEVNSHPALGWGTMSDVPSSVYTRLLEDTLSILLLEEDWDKTGFILLN